MSDFVEQSGRPDTYEGYRAEHDGQLRHFAEKLKAAQNVVDLRQAWTESPLVGSIAAYVSESAHSALTESATGSLERLGIDLGTPDERVTHLLKAIKASVADERGDYVHGLHDPVLTGIYRVISACDPSWEHGLKLRDAQLLVDNSLPNFPEAAMSFTEGDEHTIPHRFPRKASHVVIDPRSPFWGFGVYTDTWPGYRNENIYLHMPSGLTTRVEILRTESSTDRAYLERTPLYIPRSVDVQSLHLGSRDPGSRQVDTANGLVSQFIQSIRPSGGSAAGW